MALTPGTRLGPFEIQSALGAGGMGEVYRARDTRLNRDVALKILPELFAADPDRLVRFEREAQMLAALNHPNIAAIYGFEDRALVMELVEGETLADRITRAAMPLDETLPIARQIADALEAAHEQGIVHRDLKPANVKLRPDGTVKLLDFGLAKVFDTSTSGPGVSQSPTITTPAMTRMGVILGTAAYMAPEQARGRATDKRADIWAFGCVLYEMLTGTRAFEGEDVADTLGAVIHKQPAWDALPANTPGGLRALLERCLAKDPKQRTRDIGDVRLELESALHQAVVPSTAVTSTGVSSPRSWIAWTGWVLAVIAGVGAAVLAFTAYRRSPVPADPVTFEIFAPENMALGISPVVSPDGRRVAFSARGRDGRTLVWVRTLASLEARPLAGTDQATSPLFWSPDSRFIAFVSGGGAGNFSGAKLKKVDASGGPPASLCDLPGTYRGGAWSSTGVILLGVAQLGLWQVPDSGGRCSEVTSGDRGVMPSFLPDGRHFIYTRATGISSSGGLYVGSLDAGPNQQGSKRLLADQSGAIYAAAADPRMGYLLFVRDSSLVAQPFDPGRLELAGDTVPVAENVLQSANTIPFSASATGALAFRTAGGAVGSHLLWFDRQGKPLGQVGPPGRYGDIRLSVDGRTLVVDGVTAQSSVGHVWTVDLRRQTFGLLNPGSDGDLGVANSPDGKIAFTSNASGDIYSRYASGAGEPELLVKSSTTKHPNDWSRDGRFIIYDDHHPTRRQDLYILPLSGDRKPVPFVVTPADETEGAFSPDGKWIAYSSDESGRRDVYVRDFAPNRVPASGSVKVPISTTGGYKPRWHPNGRELFYLALDGTMMSVPVTAGATFEPGLPTALFKTRATGFVPYDVSSDGHFLVNTLLESAGAESPITVVLNWPSALRK